MDGLIYLTDLRTQPMRSNLGMDVWDSDEDIIPPPNATEGPVEQFPNEDFQGDLDEDEDHFMTIRLRMT